MLIQRTSTFFTILAFALCHLIGAQKATAQSAIGFSASDLNGFSANTPTSLQYGPDGRLYVSTQDGYIYALTVVRNGKDNYAVSASERIDLIREIPNHNDDGSPHATKTRQITGILVMGTAATPVIYVTSSDYRIGGYDGAIDTNLDTNSGVLSRLTLTSPGNWDKLDLLRGLPRSEENHSPNGMAYDAPNDRLLLAVGGTTNAGAPSNNFAFLSEYALAAAILQIDLGMLEAMPVNGSGNQKYIYDLPTLDDPTRPNRPDGSDEGDPWGGNDGLNQAILQTTGPVRMYAPGFRNPYDIVITERGLVYTVDNGGNRGWGGTPVYDIQGDPSSATNKYDPLEPGSSSPDGDGNVVVNRDTLQLIHEGYYGGHPNPIRANPDGAGLFTYGTTGVWRHSTDPGDPFPLPSDWPPVEEANPIEGLYLKPMDQEGGIVSWGSSTNGLTEYTASNFDGAMKGNLLVVNFSGRLERVVLNQRGDDRTDLVVVASNFGLIPLDVTAQGDGDPFPGTIWVACYQDGKITVFEPSDYDGGVGLPCTGDFYEDLDEDGDGYSNAHEILAGTDPCNAADKPSDFDGDFIPDIVDEDDDNDGIPDVEDPFQWDPTNGANTHMPFTYELLNGSPGHGFGGVGFTGWMIDYETDYVDLYNEDQLIVGGASGMFTIADIDQGTADGSANTQRNAFQFGLNVDAESGPFYVKVRLAATNLFQPDPKDNQSAGFYIGNGDQDNFVRVSAVPRGGQGGIEVYYELDGVERRREVVPEPQVLSASETIDLYLSVDPAAGLVAPSYAVDGGTIHGLPPFMVGGKILEVLRGSTGPGWSNALAIGIIATSSPSAPGAPADQTQFTANWDSITVDSHQLSLEEHVWSELQTSNSPEGRTEGSLVAVGNELILIGGRGTPRTDLLALDSMTWRHGSRPPIQLHHFQAVAFEGLVYVVGAFTGNYPREEGVDQIYLYDPVEDEWYNGRTIPETRRRGATGAALLNGKIYIAGGNVNGHGQGSVTTVPWLDVYDPLTNEWNVLPDAPRARDHGALVENGGKLYLVGGRIGGASNFFGQSLPQVDVFDPATNSWSTLPAEDNLPTPRSGIGASALGNLVVVAGGESAQPDAHDEVEAYDVSAGQWLTLPPLKEERHGVGMTAIGNVLYIGAGAGDQGGEPVLNSVERFSDPATPSVPQQPIKPGTLIVNPSTVDFGEQKSGVTARKTISIANTDGNQGIVIHDITIDGNNSYRLEHTYLMPFILAPGRQLDVDVVYEPLGTATHNAKITISFGDGRSREAAVTGESNDEGDIRPGFLTADPGQLNLGASKIGESSSSQIVVVTNTGEQNLRIDEVRLNGADPDVFNLSVTGLPVILESGDTWTFGISGTPAEEGANNAEVIIEHTGENNPTTLTVTVVGLLNGGALWDGAYDDGEGRRHSSWFDWFYDPFFPWIYHYDHGWLYCTGDDQAGFWVWSLDFGWVYLSYHIYQYNDPARRYMWAPEFGPNGYLYYWYADGALRGYVDGNGSLHVLER